MTRSLCADCRVVLSPLLLLVTAEMVCGCSGMQSDDDSPVPGKVTPSQKLAAIRRVALVSFVGTSTVSPRGPGYKALTKAMYQAFHSGLASGAGIIEFIPNDVVAANAAYQKLAKIEMPEGTTSAVEGLTYLDPGITVDSLTRELGVDAVMVVRARMGFSSRSSGAYLTVKTNCALIVPPQEKVWDHMEWPLRDQSQMMLALWEHPTLILKNGIRWVFFMGPSEADANEMMEIALTKEDNAATTAGRSMATDLLTSVRRARHSE